MENLEFCIEGNQSKTNNPKIRPRLKITNVEQSFFMRQFFFIENFLWRIEHLRGVTLLSIVLFIPKNPF